MSRFYYSPEETKALREKVIEYFGSKCMNPNCLVPGGCKDKRCLQIDHIKAVGKNRLVGAELYLDILENPNSKEIYQLLCANCNWIKRYEKHETKGNIINLISENQHHQSTPLIVHIITEQAVKPRYSSLADIGRAIKEQTEK